MAVKEGKASKTALAALFFVHAMPLGMWFVPLSNVLKTHDLGDIVPWVMACSGVSAFISPLIVGGLADQRLPPALLLRWLAAGTAVMVTLTATAIDFNWGRGAVLLFAQAQSLLSSPTWGLSTVIVLASLRNPSREFGPLRAWATAGWMASGLIVSFVLHADTTTMAAHCAAGFWLLLAVLTFVVPNEAPADQRSERSWWEILGLDALTLLKHRDHRVVFLTAGLYCIPLAAFYPYAAMHLRDLGVENISAVMSLGQITEVLVMLVLAGLLARVRLKGVFLAGIAFGVLRYMCFAHNGKAWVITGVVLHGLAFTLYFITVQIYLEERIDPKLRSRAQALLTLLMGGVGNLAGFLGSGLWFAHSQEGGKTDWPFFWWGLTAVTMAVFVWFALAYRGRKEGHHGHL
jgi:MFS family permease